MVLSCVGFFLLNPMFQRFIQVITCINSPVCQFFASLPLHALLPLPASSTVFYCMSTPSCLPILPLLTIQIVSSFLLPRINLLGIDLHRTFCRRMPFLLMEKWVTGQICVFKFVRNLQKISQEALQFYITTSKALSILDSLHLFFLTIKYCQSLIFTIQPV